MSILLVSPIVALWSRRPLSDNLVSLCQSDKIKTIWVHSKSRAAIFSTDGHASLNARPARRATQENWNKNVAGGENWSRSNAKNTAKTLRWSFLETKLDLNTNEYWICIHYKVSKIYKQSFQAFTTGFTSSHYFSLFSCFTYVVNLCKGRITKQNIR